MTQLQVNATRVDVAGIDPKRSLLGVLREDLHLTGTKEGCCSGDCGACTLVTIDRRTEPWVVRTLNSCITPLGAVLDCQVLTCEGLANGDALHPVQQAMVDEHGSQCGFCTPGFVMSLVGQQLQTPQREQLAALSRERVVQSISGNLCRCTGYRPIIAAAQSANAMVAKNHPRDASQSIPALNVAQVSGTTNTAGVTVLSASYARPKNLAALNQTLASLSANARWAFVAGSTDLWLAVTQRYEAFDQLIDISQVSELQGIEQRDGRLRIGAAVTHAELLDYFAENSAGAIIEMLHRFGSPQIRARGTIGGNIANASPIADWPPILLVLNAQLSISNSNGKLRSIALADFYLGYKQTALRNGEYLSAIELDLPSNWQHLLAHKISKRWDDDISSVFGAFYLVTEKERLVDCRIAYGGIAATPVRLANIEQLLTNLRLAPDSFTNPVELEAIEQALAALAASVQPLSDVRASAEYRRAMCVNILRNALRAAAGAP